MAFKPHGNCTPQINYPQPRNERGVIFLRLVVQSGQDVGLESSCVHVRILCYFLQTANITRFLGRNLPDFPTPLFFRSIIREEEPQEVYTLALFWNKTTSGIFHLKAQLLRTRNSDQGICGFYFSATHLEFISHILLPHLRTIS